MAVLQTAYLGNGVMVVEMDEREQLQQIIERQRREILALRRELQHERAVRAMNGQFTALVAHEIGTPLTLIRLASSFLQRHWERLPKDSIASHLARVDAQVSQMTALLDDLTLIHLMHSDQDAFHPEPLDLKTLCQTVVDQVTARWEGRPIELTCSGQLNAVRLDRRLVRYVLANLLCNALKYSPAGGEVRVELQGNAQEVVLTVSDHGIGIPAAELERLFTPFYRASNSSSFSGSGLGLALVKTCLERCDGSIRVESKLGAGTTFIVRLPHHSSEVRG